MSGTEYEQGTWGTSTLAFFHATSKTRPDAHRRSVSTPNAVFISTKIDSGPTDCGDEGYYYSTKPSSPLLHPEDIVKFQGRLQSKEYSVDCGEIFAEGRHSLLFLLNSEYVVKCAKGDEESMLKGEQEIEMYLKMAGDMHVLELADYGQMELRKITRPVLILPRADCTLDLFQSTTHDKIRCAEEVLAGLNALHSRGIVHGDLKPQNIFMVGRKAHLGDFGCSFFPSATHPSAPRTGQTGSGTLPFCAPELLAGAQPSEQADVYAAALTIHQLFTHREPFPGVTAFRLVVLIKQGFLECGLNGFDDLECEERLRQAWDAIKGCADRDPLKRPSAQEAAGALRRFIETVE